MSKISPGARRYGSGSRWHSRHHCMSSETTRRISGMLIHAPVAGAAADALGDVDAVVEVDEVRQVVHAVPHERRAARVRRPQRRERRRVAEQRPVARHARRERRNPGERRRLDGRVAVAAVDAVVADVMLVAERHGLLDRIVLRSVVARVHAVDDGERCDAGCAGEQADADQQNEPPGEYLRHECALGVSLLASNFGAAGHAAASREAGRARHEAPGFGKKRLCECITVKRTGNSYTPGGIRPTADVESAVREDGAGTPLFAWPPITTGLRHRSIRRTDRLRRRNEQPVWKSAAGERAARAAERAPVVFM